MESTKQVVPRHIKVAVVTFKITMMQVVEVVCIYSKIIYLNPVEACVSPSRTNASMEQMKTSMNRMRGNHPMQKHSRQIQEMLNRVHRQTRPWAGVGVFMMQIVGSIIKRLPMRQPMSEVEVMSPDMRNQQE